jgi:hypothetical protein
VCRLLNGTQLPTVVTMDGLKRLEKRSNQFLTIESYKDLQHFVPSKAF